MIIGSCSESGDDGDDGDDGYDCNNEYITDDVLTLVNN